MHCVLRTKKKIGRPEALQEFHGHKFLIRSFLFGSQKEEGQSNLKFNLEELKDLIRLNLYDLIISTLVEFVSGADRH